VFSNFLGLISRRGAGLAEYQSGFVREVNIRSARVRDRRMERLMWWFWAVIVVKCALVWWAMRHFHVPFHPLWVVAPTVLFAIVLTAVYAWRD
jgi:hypothetical protein